jgi:hypothetical protein
MLFVALTSLFTTLMAVSAPRAHAALVTMQGGHAYEENWPGLPLNHIVVCDTAADGYYIRGEARLADPRAAIMKVTDNSGAGGGCDGTLPIAVEIVSIRVCRVGDACTTWRPS